MPKVTFGANRKTDEMKQLERDIITNFGMFLSVSDLGKVIGKKDPKSTKKWLRESGIYEKSQTINGRKSWYVADVARILGG